MPQKICVHLQGEPPLNPFKHASGLRALVYGWLGQSSQSVAASVHDANQPKPFAISPLGANLPHAGRCSFEVSVLTDWLLTPLLEGLSSGPSEITLGREEYAIAGWELARHVAWDSLLECARRPASFRIEALTPTAHHAQGVVRRSIVTPSPELYFGSWLNKWNLCCEHAIPAEMTELVAAYLAVSAFSGGTEVVQLGRDRTFIGFTGKVKFSLLTSDELPFDAIRYLQALARFADFCGTGVDTSRGMGQTAFLE